MKAIYCKKTGGIFCLVQDEHSPVPAVLDVEIPPGKVLSHFNTESGKPVPVLLDVESTQLEVLQQELQALNEKLKTTELALAEMAMQAFTE